MFDKIQTVPQLAQVVAEVTAAQSMLLASVLRPLIARGAVSERDLALSLDLTERAAFERRTNEASALTGLIALLRRDLGLSQAGTGGVA